MASCFSNKSQVHLLNQEVHKNLRRNKAGIHVDRIEALSPDYKRPPGFTLLPTLLNASMQNKTLDKNARRHSNFNEQPVQQQQQRQQSSNKLASIVSKFSSPKPSQTNDVSAQMIRHKPPSKNEMLRLEFALNAIPNRSFDLKILSGVAMALVLLTRD